MSQEAAMESGRQDKPQQTYHAYLLRFRYAENAGRPVWRVAVQEPGSDVQLYFESLAAVYAWLAAQLGLAAVNGKPDDSLTGGDIP